VSTSTRYHFLITVTWQRPGHGPGHMANAGTIEPPPGATRSSVFSGLYRELAEKIAMLAGPEVTPCTVFFSLEPDELTAPETEDR
jgi:hypothetical protein